MRGISIFLYFFFMVIAPLFAQKQVKIFYDSLWQITRKAEAVYQRKGRVIILEDDSLIFDGAFVDESLDGTIRAKGQYVKGDKEGKFYYYHPNGVLEVEGMYKDNKQVGLWEYFNEFGGNKQSVKIDGDDFIVLEFYDEKDKPLVKQGTGNWKLFAPLGDQYALLDAHFENGRRVGKWTFRYYKGTRIFREEYDESGRLLEGIDFRGRGKSVYEESQFTSALFDIPRMHKMESLKTDENFYGPDAIRYIQGIAPIPAKREGLKPSYKGGIEAFYNYVLKNYRYPRQAYDQKLEGQVIVNFLLTAEGEPGNFNILRGISQSLNAEAVRLIQSAPGWIPATYQEKPVNTRMTIPINFKMGN